MKAIAKCPKCGKTITTNCRGCIEGGTCGCSESSEEHDCIADFDIIEGIEWKKIPENEAELKEIENMQDDR